MDHLFQTDTLTALLRDWYMYIWCGRIIDVLMAVIQSIQSKLLTSL